jgi:hypothetical protein
MANARAWLWSTHDAIEVGRADEAERLCGEIIDNYDKLGPRAVAVIRFALSTYVRHGGD